MRITCWGTRGSLPRAADTDQWRRRLTQLINRARRSHFDLDPGNLDRLLNRLPTPLTYGGETTCTQVDHAGNRLLIDMGSGLRAAGEMILRPAGNAADGGVSTDPQDHHVLLSHLHWDHIMGLPLFGPLHRPGHRLHIHHVHAEAPDHLRLLFNGVNFPLTWDAVSESVAFHHLPIHRRVEVAGFGVTAYRLDHPGDAYGFRVEAGGRSLAVAVDTEARRRTPEDLGPDAGLYRGADVLLIDAQYPGALLPDRSGWGHASPGRAVELARNFDIPRLLLTHHDPAADDDAIDAMLDEAHDALAICAKAKAEAEAKAGDLSATKTSAGVELAMAYDGLRLELPPVADASAG